MNCVVQNAGRCVGALLVLSCACQCGAQTFHELVGYPSFEMAHESKRTSDGGFVTVGSITDVGNFRPDFHIVRYDPSGTPIWDVRYGVTASSDEAYSVEQTSDGGFLVVGSTDVFGPLLNIAVLRLDALGGVVWAGTYEGDAWQEDLIGAEQGAQNVHLLTDGSAVIVGRKLAQGYQGGQALRITGAGAVVFNRAFFTGNQRSTTFAQISGAGNPLGLAIAGSIDWSFAGGPTDLDVLGIRFTPAGMITAANRIATFDAAGTPVSQQANGLEIANNSDLLINARISDFLTGTLDGTEFLRVDPTLAPVLARHYRLNSLGQPFVPASAAIKENRRDGNIVMGGTTYFGDGGQNAWMYLIEPSGDTVWCSLFGAPVAFTNGQSVIAPRNAASWVEYLLAGGAISAEFGLGATDIYFLRTDSSGQTGCFEECVLPDVERAGILAESVVFTQLNLEGVESFPGQWLRKNPPAKVLCSGKLCPADLNSDGVIDLLDFFDFFNYFDLSDPNADINNDCVVDLNDYFAFLGLFDTSCL